MSRVLGQGGISLADTYDVDGSQVVVDELLAAEGVHLQENMGNRMWSERAVQFFLELSNGDVLQSVAWDIESTLGPNVIQRILNIQVIAESDRVERCGISLQDTNSEREIPLWAWETATDVSLPFRWSHDGAAAGEFILLQPRYNYLPNMMFPHGARSLIPRFVFRGIATAFGAGNIEVFALIQLARAEPTDRENSSYGLPVPGW